MPEQRCPEDARWDLCVPWLPAGESVSLPGPGQGGEGAAGALQSAGPGCGLAEQGVPVWLWPQTALTVCLSGSSRSWDGSTPSAVVWSWGRAEPPAPASPALQARMDALTQLLALCYCKLQPGMKTRAGAA